MRHHQFITYCLSAVLLLTAFSSCNQASSREQRVLVFSKTAGFRHKSIETGVEAIRKLGKENGFTVVHSEDSGIFTEDNLKNFSAVIFLSTTGDILDAAQQAEFERYIQAGGGFVGIHAAADTEYDWPWYGDLVGGYFHSHPQIQEAQIKVVDKSHISTKMLPDVWKRTDEWYNYKDRRDNTNVLLKMDESSYQGGNMNGDHPIAWYHEFDGGRAWYTGLGHTEESYSEPLFLQHILGGIQYAIGKNKIDYGRASTQPVPDPTRFVKTVLASNLDEPMELDMLPDGRILFVERKGAIKMYDPERDYLSTVTVLPVYTQFEDGLLGLAIDPNYAENNWIYLYYSDPDPDKWEQHLSRFVFRDDSLHRSSEKVLLSVNVQREECCHSGGSVEFGPDGLLYLSTGDDTNPFASDGFNPIDERPGRSSWDAQRSSANTNDLRGKILRIRPEADGAYSIPDGNLFPKGTPKTRPEIYAMGLRNPFRISIDQGRNWLFWGDVGPDAGKDSLTRGPKGLDGINLARKAGFWGWPYSRGNNQAYHDYNFATGQSGPLFDPAKPINESPNNTGLRELPPAQSYLIWYSYDESKEFPWVGTGGKNPMAGPVYYVDKYPAETRFPDYFNGKLIIYEWMRNWMYVVRLDSLGRFRGADPFMAGAEFSRPMDMIIGHNGSLYLLEYGTLWFSRNLDARLSRIDYIRGNRGPKAVVTADRTVGGAPLTVQLSADQSDDLDHDKLAYEWTVGGQKLPETGTTLTHTFPYPGIYPVKLKVRDPEGRWDIATLDVQVGNEPPVIAWQIPGNQSFYWDNRTIPYQVTVSDREDGRSDAPGFDPARVSVTFDYLPQGADMTIAAQGHLAGMAASRLARGAKLIEESDCKNCHAADKKVNGPSYQDIARRYHGNSDAVITLATKVINGGSGVWGETVMAAHPTLTEEQAREIVEYILSLGNQPAARSTQTRPLQGTLVANEHLKQGGEGQYVLMATYTDLGNGKISPITAREEIVLRNPRLQAEACDEKSRNINMVTANNMDLLVAGDNDYFGFRQIDLTGVKDVQLRIGAQEAVRSGKVELRSGSSTGELLGSAELTTTAPGLATIDIPVSPQEGKHTVFFVFRQPSTNVAVDWAYFRFDGQEAVSMRGM